MRICSFPFFSSVLNFPRALRLCGVSLAFAFCSSPGFSLWLDSSALAGSTQPPPVVVAEKLTIITDSGRFDFDVEIADDSVERSRGLMFREWMPLRRGMLFVFDSESIISMWMKDTPMSLDMIFIDSEGIALRIVEDTVPFSETVISSVFRVSYVLELRGGVSDSIGLEVGDRLEHRFFPPE